MQYLMKFGYVDHGNVNEEQKRAGLEAYVSLDGNMKKALLNFQSSAGIKKTGELDKESLQNEKNEGNYEIFLDPPPPHRTM